jgi:hypothetical protein
VSFIDRSPLLAGLNYAKGQVLYHLKLQGHRSGSTAHHMSIEEVLRYVRNVVADYLEYGAGGEAGRLHGKDVLEIGPGDNLGVALLLLAKGARTVTCVDGFNPTHDPQHNARLYAALYNSLSLEERELVRDTILLQPDGTAVVGGERLKARYGVRIDTDKEVLEAGRYDIIVSRAVLEHIGDLAAGWRAMVGALRPTGEMWHKVDFRCHNLFGQIHPLYFLTIHPVLWDLISRPDPTLNRLRLPEYSKLAARDFQYSQMYITHIVGEEELTPHVEHLVAGRHYGARHLELIQSIRPRLRDPFSDHSDEDLLVTGVFLAVRGLRA